MKISIGDWSLHREFEAKRMDLISYIGAVKNEFGLDTLEFGSTFAGGLEPSNLKKIKDALDSNGVRLINLPIDVGNISQLNADKRNEDIGLIKKWIDAAEYFGARSARVNTGRQPEGMFDLTITIASYKELTEYAAGKGLAMVLENHGGMSADPDNILKIFAGVNDPNFRVCPDFGNFDPEIRYDAIEKIFIDPILIHAKTYEFNEQGEHISFDFGRCMEIAKSRGYDGYYSIEFEGPGDQYKGVRNSIALIEKYL